MSTDTELLAYSRLIAGDVWRRWPGMDPDDIAQEICVYVLSTPSVLEEWHDYMEGSFDSSDQERHASNRMRQIARRAGSRYCRREIAEQTGYRPEDEAFYGVGQLRELVEHFYKVGITERPLTGRDESVTRTASDPAAGGTWLVSLLDVESGLRRLPARHRNVLKFRYKDMGDYSSPELAKMLDNLAVAPGKRQRIERLLGTTDAQIRMRVRRALGKLQEKLGGPNPYRDDLVLTA